MMYRAKRKSASTSDVSSEKPPLTIEEIDCDRRGYKLTDKTLGTGAYAKVKLAYVSATKRDRHPWLKADLDKKDDNKVAIKIISKKNAPVEYLEKFMPREIDALNATCRHRNVITLYETFRSETKIYLVMEYAALGDLLGFINAKTRKGQPLTEEKAKVLFRQLVLGITHCHQRNVVHRDLKCENVLIDENDVIKVTDFGFATRYPTNKCTFLDTFCGSYAYAAPEILSAHKYDGKLADIWSLGVILFAMVCGRLPYNDKSLNYLIEQTKKKVTFPERLNPSSELRDLVHGILVYDANSRMSLSEILLHPWLAMTKVAIQSQSSTSSTSGKPSRKVSEKTLDKSIPCLTGKITPERRPRPLGVPRQQHKIRKPPDSTNIQFLVTTNRECSTCKTAIPKGTWSPRRSMPETCHVAKFLRDKTNNDVMKLLMNSSPERFTIPGVLRKLSAVAQPQVDVVSDKKAQAKSTGESEGQTVGQRCTTPVVGKAEHDGVYKNKGSIKSGVFLRTVHTLYKCKKAEDDIAEKKDTQMEPDRAITHQGFLKTHNLDYDKYNFPPVSNRSTPEAPRPQERVTSSRLSRLATWRNPLASVRNNRTRLSSRFGKKYSSARSSRNSCYEQPESPLGITRLGKTSGYGGHARQSTSPCRATKKTREMSSHQRPLVSKVTVHVVK